jgi:GAF domain-containing protein
MTETPQDPRFGGAPSEADAARAAAVARSVRHRDLSLAKVADSRFDELARKIVESTGATAAMVNLVGQDGQYFAGLHGKAPSSPGEPAFLGDPGREMDLDHGFCVSVVARRKALVLDDIYAYPRFAGNPVVDELGVRSYLGAPLIDDEGNVLGTVCAIDPAPRSAQDNTSWGQHGLQVIKAAADEVVAEIRSRQQIGKVTAAAQGSVMLAALPGLEVLHVNTAHEQLFGGVPELGGPAHESFPGLANVGVLAAVQHLQRTGEAAATAPVPLAEEGHTVLF